MNESPVFITFNLFVSDIYSSNSEYMIHICILPFESGLQRLEISPGPLDIIGYLVEEVLEV